jgi:hypothetical protein
MNEVFKGFMVSVILFIVWSCLCFGSGYLLCDKQATKRINKINQQLAEQQQKYDELIRITDERIRNIKAELFGQIQDNGTTIDELSRLIEQIGKQKLNI